VNQGRGRHRQGLFSGRTLQNTGRTAHYGFWYVFSAPDGSGSHILGGGCPPGVIPTMCRQLHSWRSRCQRFFLGISVVRCTERSAARTRRERYTCPPPQDTDSIDEQTSISV